MRVQQILINLLSNAIKFSRKYQWIDVIANYEQMTQSSLELTIKVVDQGTGISEEDQKQLFKVFFKSSSEKSKALNKNSNGIGLYTSKRIAEQLGGDLTYKPLRQGSQFKLTLKLNFIDAPLQVSCSLIQTSVILEIPCKQKLQD